MYKEEIVCASATPWSVPIKTSNEEPFSLTAMYDVAVTHCTAFQIRFFRWLGPRIEQKTSMATRLWLTHPC